MRTEEHADILPRSNVRGEEQSPAPLTLYQGKPLGSCADDQCTRAAQDAMRKASEDETGMLTAIKVLHTVVWALLAGAIVALPFLAIKGAFRWAAIISIVIFFEGVVLLANGWRCPLTDLAAKYTTDRSPNFDIYIPNWLARHNKTIFGTLFLVNEAIVLVEWLRSR